MAKNVQPESVNDAMLVGKSELCAALEVSVCETPGRGYTFLESEPFLSDYCRAELFQVLGKLAVSGASAKVVRGVGADVHRLVVVAATAMRSGYCILLEDFLPEFAVATADSNTPSTDDDESSE